MGPPSILPEQLLKATLNGFMIGITSERRLMREIQVNQKNRNQRFNESEVGGQVLLSHERDLGGWRQSAIGGPDAKEVETGANDALERHDRFVAAGS